MEWLKKLMAWIKYMLSESDGSPSSSRTVMLLWSIALLLIFTVTALWESYHTGQMPNVEKWGTFLGASQAGGTLGYLGNQLRRVFTKNDVTPPPAS